MCENEARIKPMPLPSSKKGVFGWSDGVIKVKLNFKGDSRRFICNIDFKQSAAKSINFPY